MAVQQKEEEEKKAKAAADAQNAQSQQTADQLGKFSDKINTIFLKVDVDN